MNITDIPFVNHLKIEKESNNLVLNFKDENLNHIKTIHAGAQFTLAETQSGLYLQQLFPKLEGKVMPILRDANIKYKKPATEKIIAFSFVSDEAIEKFNMQFNKKGRATITVDVELKDINSIVTAQASFNWYIQAI